MSPTPSSLWLVAGHLESANPVEQLHDLRDALGHGKLGTAALVEFPQFKVRSTVRSLPSPNGHLFLHAVVISRSSEARRFEASHMGGQGSKEDGSSVRKSSSSPDSARSPDFLLIRSFSPCSLQTGTLSSLLTLSEQLAKHDPNVTSTLQKTVDTIRSLTAEPTGPTATIPHAENRASPLTQHLVLDDGRPYLSYLLPDEDSGSTTESDDKWEWNRSKYRTEDRSLGDVVDALVKETASIENAQRNKTQQYQLVKGQLTNALRKKTCVLRTVPLLYGLVETDMAAWNSGNLSMRSLADVVSASDFAATHQSEYLETALVAVPKYATPRQSGPPPDSDSLCFSADQEPGQGVGQLVRAAYADGGAEVIHVSLSRPAELSVRYRGRH